ncbi:MAG: hypothetical protein JKX80_03040 [Candidatus Pacebacteria bacterium]|nr:hypothetical protein [Candidatus Paceibacterota bacterium]
MRTAVDSAIGSILSKISFPDSIKTSLVSESVEEAALLSSIVFDTFSSESLRETDTEVSDTIVYATF